MNIRMSLRRADCRFARIMLVAWVPFLLPACAGEGRNETPQAGKVERSLDVSGRWSLQTVTAQNDCGIPQGSTRLLVDITQDGTEVLVSSTRGSKLWRGNISDGKILADSSATVEVDGRRFSYVLSTQLALKDNTLVGEESFRAGEGAQPDCSGKTQLNAVRSINRSRRATAYSGDKPFDLEPNDTVSNAVALPVNESVMGAVNAAADRVDIYALPLEKPGTYQVGVSGFGSSDLDIALVDRLHHLLASSENAPGVDEGLAFSVDTSQNAFLYLIVSGFDTGEQSGDYTVTLTAP